MTPTRADFAIVGSTPLARLLAGLLASAHGKSVVFIGDSQAGYRLPRGLDLSLAPLTRPETWSLLKTAVPEALKLMSRIGGRSAWSRVNPIMFSETDVGHEALGHIRHMASAFGHATERVTGTSLGAGREGLLVRDAIVLHRPALEARLDAWLVQLKVGRVEPGDSLTINMDGSATLGSGDVRIEISQTVLADDEAIMAHVPSAQWPALLARRVASSILTEPTRPILAPIMLRLDSGLSLMQQGSNGIVALRPGTIGPLAGALGTMLGQERAFRQAGQSRYDTIVSTDFAPAVGRLGGTGPDILAHLGPSAAFLAPAIARWLCGKASIAENDWLGARLVDRNPNASQVAEYGVPS